MSSHRPTEPHRPPTSDSRPKSFLEERGREIVAGIIIIVVAAAIIGGASQILSDGEDNPTPTPELPADIAAALGDWDFLRYEGPSPVLPPGPCFEPGSISFLANHTYLANTVFCDTGQLHLSQEGIFVPVDNDTVEMRDEADSSLIGVQSLAVNGDEL